MEGRRVKRIVLKVAAWTAGFFAFFSIVGFFILPPLAKSIATKKLSEALHREVTIEKVTINPYTLFLSVQGFTVRDKDRKAVFVSFGELAVRMSPASVYKRAPVIREVKLDKPYVRVIRNLDETFNFSDLTEPPPKAKGSRPVKGKKAEPFLFSVNNITVSGGHIEFFDGPKNVEHVIKDMNVGVPFVSNMGDRIHVYVEPSFSANINGDMYSLKGKTKPFADSLESYIDIDIKNLRIPRYMPYMPAKANFTLNSAALTVAARVSFVRPKDKAQSATVTGDVILRDVAVNDLAKRPVLRLGSCGVSITDLRLFARSAHLAKVTLKDLQLTVRRDEKGELSLTTLIGKEKEEKEKAAPRETPAKAPPRNVAKAEETPLPDVRVDEFVIDKGSVFFHDAAPGGPVKVEVTNLALKGENIATAKGSTCAMTLSLLLNRKGSVSLRGPVSINPLSADLAVLVKGIDISAFQPYFTHKVKLAVTRGKVETKGRLVLGEKKKEGLQVSYKGSILVSNFASVDKGTGDSLLRFKALSLPALDAGFNPVRANLGNISLADFYAGLAVERDGTLNLKNIFVEEEAEEDKAPAAKAQKAKGQAKAGRVKEAPKPAGGKAGERKEDIAVGAITLQGGTIEFFDRSITPRYSASLTSIAGRVAGFSLGKSQNAAVSLKGNINRNVPLDIGGTINPVKDNLFADLTVKFNDLELSGLSPYSGKYIGYKIEKGKLSMDLKYLIKKRDLDSTNVIFIDQLTLGEKVESPEALNLPFRLAIALLKDRHGRITLDVPVSGSFDDPQFSVFRIIIKVIGNLIVKAATAPFALLGALVGGGEELSYIEFDYGSSTLTPGDGKKIDALAKALFERPQLKLDIRGSVDVEKDREALHAYFFRRKLKVQKMNDMIKKGQTVGHVDDITVEPAEYTTYLTKAYKAETFAKPRNALGFTKSLPPVEMEKLMMTHIVVTDGDLRALADQRARHAKEGLLKTGKVTADRMFVVEPKSGPSEKKEKGKKSRVDFTLK